MKLFAKNKIYLRKNFNTFNTLTNMIRAKKNNPNIELECIRCLKKQKHTYKNESIRNWCRNCKLLNPYRKYITCSHCDRNEILTNMPVCSSCNTRCYFDYIRCFNCDSKRLWSNICFNDPNQAEKIPLLNLEYTRIRKEKEEKEEIERERRREKERERERIEKEIRREKERERERIEKEIRREEMLREAKVIEERTLLMKTERDLFKDIPISERSIIQNFDNEEGVNLIYIEGDPVLKTTRTIHADNLHLYHLIYKQQQAIAKLQSTLGKKSLISSPEKLNLFL